MSEWIKCSEWLPEIGSTVLVIDRGGSITNKSSIKQVTRNGKSSYLWKKKNGKYFDFAPEPRYSHWMPLPKIPEKL